MTFTVEGRVLSVTPRSTGGYGVTVGPAPDLYWYVAAPPPPRLGADVKLLAERVVDVRQLSLGAHAAKLTLVDGVTPHPEATDSPTLGRVVAPVWFERVRSVMTRPLRVYQEEGAAWLASRMVSNLGSILADEPGTGKTAQTVAAVCATRTLPVLVVATKSLVRNWEREFGYANVRLRVAIIRTGKGKLPRADVLITTYQILRARELDFGRYGFKGVVFDEAHALKEARPANKHHRAAVATRLGLAIGRPVFLTGSPVLNRPDELWRILHIANPKAWPDFVEYRDRYCRAPSNDEEAAQDESVRERRILTDTGRVENVDELRTRVDQYMLRRLKSDVAKDLPPKSRQSVLVELDESDLAVYRQAEKDVSAWLRANGQHLQASRAKKAEALVRLTHLRRLLGEAKLRTVVPQYLREWFDRETPEPLIVFGYFRAVCQGVFEIASKLGITVSTIRGDDSDKKRQAAIDAFQEGKTQLFVAPIKAAGVGINLQRASDVLFVERHWVTEELKQAEDRAHRLGQTDPVTVTYLDAHGTIDQDLARVNAAKSALIDALVDDRRTEGDNFDSADDVIRSFARAEREGQRA